MLMGLGGGCLVPIAALATVTGGELRIRGLVASPDGSDMIREAADGDANDPEGVGSELASKLLGRGAGDLLARPPSST